MSDNRPCPDCAADPIVGGSPRRCAFSGDGGRFVTGNRSCPTAERLARFAMTWKTFGIPEPTWTALAWSDDQSCAVLGRQGTFLILGWYKSRSALEACAILRDGEIDPMPRLSEVLPFLENGGAQYR